LNFHVMDTDFIDVRFAIADSAFADAQDWLGNENLRKVDGKWYADTALPNDDALVRKILSLGEGIRVLSPTSLKEKVAKAAKKIAENYL